MRNDNKKRSRNWSIDSSDDYHDPDPDDDNIYAPSQKRSKEQIDSDNDTYYESRENIIASQTNVQTEGTHINLESRRECPTPSIGIRIPNTITTPQRMIVQPSPATKRQNSSRNATTNSSIYPRFGGSNTTTPSRNIITSPARKSITTLSLTLSENEEEESSSKTHQLLDNHKYTTQLERTSASSGSSISLNHQLIQATPNKNNKDVNYEENISTKAVNSTIGVQPNDINQNQIIVKENYANSKENDSTGINNSTNVFQNNNNNNQQMIVVTETINTPKQSTSKTRVTTILSYIFCFLLPTFLYFSTLESMNYRHKLQTSILQDSIRQEQEYCQNTIDRDTQYMDQLNQGNKALLQDLQTTRNSFINLRGLDRFQFESHWNTSQVEITNLQQQLNETIDKIGSYQEQVHHLMEVGKEQKVTISSLKKANEKLQKQVQELTIGQVESKLVDEMNKANIGDLTRLNQELRKGMEQLKVQLQTQEQEAVSALNAVAMSATVRKVRQVQDVMAENQDQIDSVVKSAVAAMNTVAASNILPKKRMKKEVVDDDDQVRS